MRRQQLFVRDGEGGLSLSLPLVDIVLKAFSAAALFEFQAAADAAELVLHCDDLHRFAAAGVVDVLLVNARVAWSSAVSFHAAAARDGSSVGGAASGVAMHASQASTVFHESSLERAQQHVRLSCVQAIAHRSWSWGSRGDAARLDGPCTRRGDTSVDVAILRLASCRRSL